MPCLDTVNWKIFYLFCEFLKKILLIFFQVFKSQFIKINIICIKFKFHDTFCFSWILILMQMNAKINILKKSKFTVYEIY